ncbi:homocysteine S-methyltransferase family protein [Pectinatus cerevisiiphilus]|uniref:Methionine synthase n=1 Tax=Pectinatus cerevisiiphilus TaxID=86956 RepID=A0A4R3KEU5_9FIRM|nr:homocysteine S-methyltransferase family protein [Pectinatus cerevisiiphilus]TCS81864.1 5-methyltetrahydrofolate--homocysteine methyltransferase [Pectinatus cerevisiiphilus]
MINIFDGAMGTILQADGILKPGVCPELLNIQSAQAIINVHKQYISAGATIIETNTFGGSSLKLAQYGLTDKVRAINIAGVKNAKAAMQHNGKVAGSMGPIGRFIEPLGDISFDTVYKAYFEQASALAEGGADYILIETCIDLQEMRAALLAAKDAAPGIPVICQMSYSEDARTVTGTDPQTAAITLEAMGADIIGANCSTGPEELLPIVKILAQNCKCPISVQPNAGMPHLINGKTIFPMHPADMGKWAPKLIEAGATFIGGCCGTTPAHIAAIKEAVSGLADPVRSPLPHRLALTSRTKTIFIGTDLPTRLIGERINPTGRKKLAAEIKAGSFISVKKEAVEQTNAGADILDVNMGVGGIDQTAAMEKAIKEIAQIVSTPLSIDTSDPKALEAGLKVYPGRALINSVSAEPDRLKYFLPLAKRYGAAVLCLPLSDKGLPKTGSERVAIIEKIIAAAKQAGLQDNDFILDCLVMTVAADKTAALEVLQALSLYHSKFGYPSTMGLSNISFGLPDRPLINSTFFAMCLAYGLNAPIMNPYDSLMKNTLLAASALNGNDPHGQHYSLTIAKQPHSETAAAAEVTPRNIIEAIKHSIIVGEKENIAQMVEHALKEGHTSNEITENALTTAMNAVGKDFGAKKIFLPQVMLSAEAMREAFLKIKEILPSQASANKGTVVIATVKGDIHDLGKNIVSALLENNGFKLIDLGKDVDSEKIVRTAIENDADIVGLCSLMTTTMTQIDKVIASLKKAGSTAQVIVGGAVLTQEYADSAGADAYAEDGVIAVEIAKKLTAKRKGSQAL